MVADTVAHGPSSIDHFGLLNISKPAGVSSRTVVSRVQRLVRPAKIGHAGTLDPLATGVLVVCIGKATRLVPLIHEMDKVYRATFLLGRTSQTDDIEATVVEIPAAPRPTRAQIVAALPAFVGRIQQRPPAYSAVRVGGRRAYKLARQGRNFEIASRPVDVHRIDVLRFDYPELVLEITCGTGTYIRSIGRDLGEQLAGGAVMSALERTAVGPFTQEKSAPLADVTRESLPLLIQSAVAAVPSLPRCVVDQDAVRSLAHGRCVARPDAGDGEPGESIAVVDAAGQLVALAEERDGMLVPRQVFASAQ